MTPAFFFALRKHVNLVPHLALRRPSALDSVGEILMKKMRGVVKIGYYSILLSTLGPISYGLCFRLSNAEGI